MDDFARLSIALASLLGLACWARSTTTRAWGEPAEGRMAVWATLLLQVSTALVTGPWEAGAALIAAAWMLLGAALVLAMNQWPVPAHRWAARLGWLGASGCLAVLATALQHAG